jgi:hypothetical protein
VAKAADRAHQTSAKQSTPKYTTENVEAWFRATPSAPVELNASREAMINATLADIRANVDCIVERKLKRILAVQRHTPVTDKTGDADMEKDDAGEWVQLEDVEEAVRTDIFEVSVTKRA